MPIDTAFHASLNSPNSPDFPDTLAASPSTAAVIPPQEIIFIDQSFYPTEAHRVQVQGLGTESCPTTGVESLMLESERNGVYQISDALIDRSQMTDLHLVVPGAPGQLQLGNAVLNLETIDQYRHEFPIWQEALADDAEIWIHCDALSQDDGTQAFLQRLSQLTQRMVYSTDRRF